MPGKVNPVICESAMMVACRVQGNDLAVAAGGHRWGGLAVGTECGHAHDGRCPFGFGGSVVGDR